MRAYYAALGTVLLILFAHPDTQPGVIIVFRAVWKAALMFGVTLTIAVTAIGIAVLFGAWVGNRLRRR